MIHLRFSWRHRLKRYRLVDTKHYRIETTIYETLKELRIFFLIELCYPIYKWRYSETLTQWQFIQTLEKSENSSSTRLIEIHQFLINERKKLKNIFHKENTKMSRDIVWSANKKLYHIIKKNSMADAIRKKFRKKLSIG